MKKVFYVVSFKKKLYVASRMYSLYQSTTDDIMKAVHFSTIEEAEKICSKTKGGEVEEYILQDIEGYNLASDELRAANIQLQQERNEALRQLQEFKETVFKKQEGEQSQNVETTSTN